MVGHKRRARAALWLTTMRSAAGTSATSGLGELTRAWHCIDGARDLWVAIVENLRRGAEPVGRRQQVVAQLHFSKTAQLVELLRCCLVVRLRRRKLLQLFEERIRDRKVVAHEIVIKLDRALNFVLLETRNTS